MKKLVIAATIVCAVAVSHAAAYEWFGSNVYQCWDSADSENWAGGNAYLFIAGVNSATYDGIMAAVESGTFVADNWVSKSVSSVSLETNQGLFGGSFNTGKDGVDYAGSDMFAVILADRYWDESGKLVELSGDPYAAYTKSITAGAQPTLGSAEIKFGSMENTWTPDGWTAQGTSDVPEPTSGLLLILGVAGLGLKRRRV